MAKVPTISAQSNRFRTSRYPVKGEIGSVFAAPTPVVGGATSAPSPMEQIKADRSSNSGANFGTGDEGGGMSGTAGDTGGLAAALGNNQGIADGILGALSPGLGLIGLGLEGVTGTGLSGTISNAMAANNNPGYSNEGNNAAPAAGGGQGISTGPGSGGVAGSISDAGIASAPGMGGAQGISAPTGPSAPGMGGAQGIAAGPSIGAASDFGGGAGDGGMGVGGASGIGVGDGDGSVGGAIGGAGGIGADGMGGGQGIGVGTSDGSVGGAIGGAGLGAADGMGGGQGVGGGGGGGGGACFLTTATVQHMGHADDGPVLQALRRFRDTYMRGDAEKDREIDWYYRNAPKIVSALDASRNAAKIYRQMYRAFIAPAYDAIESNQLDRAYSIYKKLVNFAQRKAGLGRDDLDPR